MALDFGVAVGFGSECHGDRATCLGNVSAFFSEGAAIGASSRALQNGSIAIGGWAVANDLDIDPDSSNASISIGSHSWAQGYRSIAIGHGSSTAGFNDSIVIGNNVTATRTDAVFMPLRGKAHDSVCMYDTDTGEITRYPAPHMGAPYVISAGSFELDGSKVNNNSYNCSCVASRGYDPTTLVPDDMEDGHYAITFGTAATNLNYSIMIQPQVTNGKYHLAAGVMTKTVNGFTFRTSGAKIATYEAFSIIVMKYT